MLTITCPDNSVIDELKWTDWDARPDKNTFVFLAGGITDCPDWQQDAIKLLKHSDKAVLMNPRRKFFDINDHTVSAQQIKWEHEHLEEADAILFWFPQETLCPITLFELGKYGRWSSLTKVFVGCHPNYKRRFDVIQQMRYINQDLIVRDNLEDVVSDLEAWLVERHQQRIDDYNQLIFEIENEFK